MICAFNLSVTITLYKTGYIFTVLMKGIPEAEVPIYYYLPIYIQGE